MSEAKRNEIVQSGRDHVWHHLTQHKAFENADPLVIVKGEGMTVTDITGKQYLDATSGGLWTVNVGYARESLAQVVKDQLLKMPFFAGFASSEPGAKYAEELIKLLPGLNRVYYSNSGSEANEKAYKIVRQRSAMFGDDKKHKIIFRDRDYHGTTITNLSATGQFERKNQYAPFTPGFVEMPHCCCYRCPFSKKYGECNIECAHALEDIILKEGPDTVGSVILEPITAGGGVIVPVQEYFPIIQEICKKYDVLLHIDEVVCGVGRTGKWFGYQNFGVQPDLVTSAKGLASGYAAISVTVATEEVFNLFKNDDDRMGYFRDISTFGGCTSGPAAALENLNIIKNENLLSNISLMGDYFKDKLYELQNKHKAIGEVRGMGLILGIELVKDRETKEPIEDQLSIQIAKHCLKNGVMVGRTNRSFINYNNVIIFSPAFICTKDDIDNIIIATDNALSDLT